MGRCFRSDLLLQSLTYDQTSPMPTDTPAELKEKAKTLWSGFIPMEMVTASVAPKLVAFAGIEPGLRVLDVGCGTGVVAMTAARKGARVTGADLTPALLERARENASIMGLEVEFHESDVEALPFAEGSFDVVVSQFGHMFAPNPAQATAEMLRVLKPGGTIAFSTWPPELMIGRFFALLASYGPPAPAGATSPILWGEPSVVRERLGSAVRNLTFDRAMMRVQTLSVQHQRHAFETGVGPMSVVMKALSATDPARLAQLRQELDALFEEYFVDNHLRQDFLLSRAVKC